MEPAEFAHLQVEFKSGQYARKCEWHSVFLSGLPGFCKQMKSNKYEFGVEAIWLKPCWIDSNGLTYDWTVLDIEAPDKDHHSNIRANLEAGREFLRIICENRLEVGLIIFLSGKGLRFCWPYLIPAELRKAFRAWITDQTNFPMIDPAPFTKKAFYRMFGNRNHRNQGAVLNRHIHRLSDYNDLWFLDETEYLSLVSGTVDLNTSLAWLAEIIPVTFTPAPWRAFLNEYKTRAALADTIFRPIIPKRKCRKPIPFLAEQAGFEFRQMQFAHGVILQLRVCPICGRKDGRTYVTESGRLKCHHANTCEAGTVDDQGRIIGIPVDGWLPGALSDEFEPFMDEDTGERITLEAARDALREAFNGDGDTYITLSPGAGKSYTMILEIMGAESGKVAIATPEHRLNQEFFNLALSMTDRPQRIHWLQGRNKSNCTQIDKVQDVARAGFSPGIIVCGRCPIKRNHDCEYYRQFESLTDADGLWLMTHAMALEINLAKNKFTLLIVDESPTNTFLQEQVAAEGAMLSIQSKMPPEGRACMKKLLSVIPQQLAALEAAKASKYDLSRIYTIEGPIGSPWVKQPGFFDVAGLTPDDRDQLDRALSIFQRFDAEKITAWQRRLYYEAKIDLNALDWLTNGLAGKSGVYVRFQKDRKNPAKFISFQKRLPKHSGRVICLDATGCLPELESLHERKFRHVQGRVQMPGLRSIWVKQRTGKNHMSKMSDKQIARMMKSAAEFLKPDDQKVLIVTHMAVEDAVKRLAGIILPGREIHTCHFWGGSRGVNEFGECTTVIALGTPFPNIGGLFDHAMSLMSSQSERLQWFVATGTAELIQALHRVRPVKGNRTVIVVGRDFPVAEFGNPQIKLNLSRGDKAAETSITEIVDRLTPFVARWKFMTKEVGWAFKIYLEADKDKAVQATEYIQDCIKELEKHGYNLLDLLAKTESDEQGMLPIQFYLLYTLLGKTVCGAIPTLPFATFKDLKVWTAVLSLLAERFSLPKMSTLSTSSSGKQVHGVGYLSSVRKFLEAAHLPPESFKNIEGVESLEAEELKK